MPDLAGFLATTTTALCRPTQIYRRTRVYAGVTSARRFARRHYALITVGAACWIAVLFLAQRPGDWADGVLIVVFVSLLTLLSAWGIHRLAGLVSMLFWLRRTSRANLHAGRKIFAFESVFLWAFCTYNGLLVTDAITSDAFMTMTLFAFPARMLGTIPPVAALILGNASLFAVWLRRFHVAMLRMRWSND